MREPYPDWPPDQDEPLAVHDDAGEQMLPGMPAGFLAYQINYRCVKGCTHSSSGASVDGGGRGTGVQQER